MKFGPGNNANPTGKGGWGPGECGNPGGRFRNPLGPRWAARMEALERWAEREQRAAKREARAASGPKRPPVETSFASGHSGNPGGRLQCLSHLEWLVAHGRHDDARYVAQYELAKRRPTPLCRRSVRLLEAYLFDPPPTDRRDRSSPCWGISGDQAGEFQGPTSFDPSEIRNAASTFRHRTGSDGKPTRQANRVYLA
jgi:hypothetical protein